ncbi:MAG: metallophosphoesterase, partial [Candidatus Omnitrophica bacterium]|nr:metallophosphoesterase [Candidatus Omnitrophota bacterium]
MLTTKVRIGALIAILGVLTGFPPAASVAETAKGVVFADINGNGKQDNGENGIPKIMVSNQREVVETDSEGAYQIEVDDDDIIMIVKPDAYELPVNKDHLPQFFYIHKPKGSPEQKYPGVKPTGPLPESIDFPLIPTESKTDYDVVVFGDPQPADYREVEYIRDDVVAEMMNEPAVQKSAFGVTLGDVMNNDLSLFEPYNEVVGQLGKTWYNVIGNHDLNFDSPTDEFSDETWHRVFGPNYYAFFQGEVLYLALDNVHWEHFPEEKQKETG